MGHPGDCFQRGSLKKNKWTGEEDEQLRVAVSTFGTSSWNKIAAVVPSRTGKQCRERWIAQLAPSVSRGLWSPDEDAVLIRSHTIMGNRWTTIAAQLPGRSALHVKNRWSWLIRHDKIVEHQSEPPRMTCPPDVVEMKRAPVFEPINGNDRLFGLGFRQFQVKMMSA
jgi:hypothetical protein